MARSLGAVWLAASASGFGCAAGAVAGENARGPDSVSHSTAAASFSNEESPAVALEEGAPAGPSGGAAEADRVDVALLEARAARHAFHSVSFPPSVSGGAPAMKVANLSPHQCWKELTRRKLAARRVGGNAKGVATPVRLSGPMNGVAFVTPGARSVYGTLDCRLALALEELSRVLASHSVAEVYIDNLYRPRARLPGKRKKPSQHSYGLAVDVMGFKLVDGRRLVVEADFQGELGAPPCGPDAALVEPTEAAVALRTLVCDIAREGIFHHMLTPNYDRAHADHLHLDIKRDEKHFLLK